jgi:hypothetical protein
MAEINTEETVVLDNTEEFKILDENNNTMITGVNGDGEEE